MYVNVIINLETLFYFHKLTRIRFVQSAAYGRGNLTVPIRIESRLYPLIFAIYCALDTTKNLSSDVMTTYDMYPP